MSLIPSLPTVRRAMSFSKLSSGQERGRPLPRASSFVVGAPPTVVEATSPTDLLSVRRPPKLTRQGGRHFESPSLLSLRVIKRPPSKVCEEFHFLFSAKEFENIDKLAEKYEISGQEFHAFLSGVLGRAQAVRKERGMSNEQFCFSVEATIFLFSDEFKKKNSQIPKEKLFLLILACTKTLEERLTCLKMWAPTFSVRLEGVNRELVYNHKHYDEVIYRKTRQDWSAFGTNREDFFTTFLESPKNREELFSILIKNNYKVGKNCVIEIDFLKLFRTEKFKVNFLTFSLCYLSEQWTKKEFPQVVCCRWIDTLTVDQLDLVLPIFLAYDRLHKEDLVAHLFSRFMQESTFSWYNAFLQKLMPTDPSALPPAGIIWNFGELPSLEGGGQLSLSQKEALLKSVFQHFITYNVDGELLQFFLPKRETGDLTEEEKAYAKEFFGLCAEFIAVFEHSKREDDALCLKSLVKKLQENQIEVVSINSFTLKFVVSSGKSEAGSSQKRYAIKISLRKHFADSYRALFGNLPARDLKSYLALLFVFVNTPFYQKAKGNEPLQDILHETVSLILRLEDNDERAFYFAVVSNLLRDFIRRNPEGSGVIVEFFKKLDFPTPGRSRFLIDHLQKLLLKKDTKNPDFESVVSALSTVFESLLPPYSGNLTTAPDMRLYRKEQVSQIPRLILREDIAEGGEIQVYDIERPLREKKKNPLRSPRHAFNLQKELKECAMHLEQDGKLTLLDIQSQDTAYFSKMRTELLEKILVKFGKSKDSFEINVFCEAFYLLMRDGSDIVSYREKLLSQAVNFAKNLEKIGHKEGVFLFVQKVWSVVAQVCNPTLDSFLNLAVWVAQNSVLHFDLTEKKNRVHACLKHSASIAQVKADLKSLGIKITSFGIEINSELPKDILFEVLFEVFSAYAGDITPKKGALAFSVFQFLLGSQKLMRGDLAVEKCVPVLEEMFKINPDHAEKYNRVIRSSYNIKL